MVLLAGVLVLLLTLHYQLRKRELIAELDVSLQEALLAAMPLLVPLQQGLEPIVRNRPRPGMRPPRRGRPFFEGKPCLCQQPPKRGMISEYELLNQLEKRNLYLIAKWRSGVKHYGEAPQNLETEITNIALKEPRWIVHNRNRLLLHPHPEMLIISGSSLDEIYVELAHTRIWLAAIGGAVLGIGFVVGMFITGRSLRPIRQISKIAETIAKGEYNRRIELSAAPNELASLAGTLNNTFDHLNESIEAQKRFTADASHELRTPIAVVIAQTEAALQRDRTADEYRRVLEACLRAGRRMKTLAGSLLELTRISEPGLSPTITRCDLNDLLTETVNSAADLSEKHPVDFCGPETATTVEIDRDLIGQAVLNLLANAIQHNPDGCALHVALQIQNGNAVIQVIDEGVGIAAKHLQHIFERFYRVDKSRSRAQGGAGLGLSIVQGLVESHGGTVKADSQPGHGTTFTIRLPLA